MNSNFFIDTNTQKIANQKRLCFWCSHRRFGLVEEASVADLILTDGNPLENMASLLKGVLVKGFKPVEIYDAIAGNYHTGE
ncbi:hypothetical protein N474_18780 [Pseudoalteromonas luteoviolacea CPMOR-2]|uniref:Amidohydrolase-related domain-containing protein n=1 Tax=Pseudoalteromonas luteoviolacea DSM 6061 TaxID=1365250 RepID=A0A166VVU2_9GAMM|nr:hypothetical protein [Pseudoalteromonas luteoviolacea]KZN33926.1 hypothetical protein N475_19470 [Pseudoalteromonas luteoviolacea DSM 6061]KZN53890.1 hypothetical protein N474_18780 [Pseudoalteromonas luteoviolacea CPMOR-2]MBE0385844.1 hypothetical protein [Pseudoalteromonas luteoviolacea DSM 6061]